MEQNPNIPTFENTPVATTLPLFTPPEAPEIGGALSTPSPEVTSVVNSIRSQFQPTNLDNIISKEADDAGFWGSLAGPVVKSPEKEIGLDEAYSKVSSTEFVPKFEKFYTGIDNNELYAAQQGTMNKWLNGVLKNSTKAANYILGGTAGTFTGVYEAVKKGSFDGVWDNNFANWIDEQNKRLDNSLPNYVSREEQNKNLLEQLTTANFWANDFLGGMAFVVGAVGTEAAFAAVTGGSSLALSGAKLGLRGVALTNKALTLGRGSLAMSNKAVTAVRALNRTVNTSKVIGALNNARFIATSAGFESSVEARDAFNESVENFTQMMQKTYGRVPTSEEYNTFLNDAVSNANSVFATNMAVVGSSNFLQFGKMFGLSTGISEGISKTVNKKLFGLGLRRLEDGTLAAINPSKLQKFVGKTTMFLREPVIEGLEEGLQGVISRTSSSLLADKYDPVSMKDNFSTMDTILESAKEAFGSKEGMKEVMLGMLIGKMSSFLPGNKSDSYGSQLSSQSEMADAYNKANSTLTGVTRATIERMLSVNQQISNANRADDFARRGLFTEAAVAFDQSQFAKFMVDSMAGTENESLEDFKLMLSKMDNQEMADMYNVDASVVDELKEKLLTDYSNNLKLFKQSYEAAEALMPTVNIKGNLKDKHYVEELASNFYLGVKSMDRTRELANSIEESTGMSGFASILTMYTNASKEAKKNASLLRYNNTRITTLQNEYEELQRQYSTLKEKKPREGENTAHAAAVSRNRTKAAKVQEKLLKLAEESTALSNTLNTNPIHKNYAFGNVFGNDFVLGEDLMRAEEELEKLDGFVEELKKRDPESAQAINYLINEYSKNQKAFENFHDSYQKLSDQRFNRDQYKGIARFINGKGKYQAPTNRKLTPEQQAIEDIIASSNMDEYEAFNFRLFADVSSQLYKGDFSEFTMDDIQDPVTSTEWTSFVKNGIVADETLDSIAEKLENNTELSRKERRINEKYSTEVADKIKQLRKNKRDALRRAVRKPSPNESLINTSNIIRDLIKQIINSKNYLDGLSVGDFSETDVPTEEDFRELHRLQSRLALKGKLSSKLQNRLDSLTDKINKWGKIEGTLSGKYRLSDLYNQLFALERNSELETIDEVSGIEVADVINGDEIEAIGKKTYYNILQTYDKVFFSRDADGIHIHNINIQGFLETAFKNLNITSIKVAGRETELSKVDLKPGSFVRVEYKDAAGNDKVVGFTRGSRGDLVLSEPGVKNINEDTPIQIGTILTNAKIPTNYFTVLRKVVIDGKVKLVPLDSNFFDPELSSDPNQVQTLRKGDELRLDVNMNDEYNKQLYKEYKKTGDLETLAKNIKIRFIDAVNNLAGVLKAEHELDGMVANVSHFERMAELRREAAQKVVEAEGKGTIDMDSTVIVKNVFMGHPMLNIEETAGGFGVVQNSFTDATVQRISDIGFILDGKLHLRNNSDRNKLTESYVNSVLKDKVGKYTGRRVPVVVISFNGRNVLYPVSLKAEVVDYSAIIDEILQMNISDADKAIKINEVLIQNKINVQPLNIRSDNYKSKVNEAKQLLSSISNFAPVESFTDTTIPMEEQLKNNMMIDLDLNGQLFHSPKVTLDFGTNTEVKSEEIQEEEVTPSVTPSVTSSTEQITERFKDNERTEVVFNGKTYTVFHDGTTIRQVFENDNGQLFKSEFTIETYSSFIDKFLSERRNVPLTNSTIGQEVDAIRKEWEEELDTTTSAGYGVIASDYLFTGGKGSMLSTDYLLQALTASFPFAGKQIDAIRNKYASKLGNISDDVNSKSYNDVIAEIRNAINTTYQNSEIESLFDEILNNSTGFVPREGNRVSSRLETLNEEHQQKINAKYQAKLNALKVSIPQEVENQNVVPTENKLEPGGEIQYMTYEGETPVVKDGIIEDLELNMNGTVSEITVKFSDGSKIIRKNYSSTMKLPFGFSMLKTRKSKPGQTTTVVPTSVNNVAKDEQNKDC